MQRKAEKDFIACGGGWPDSEDGLCEYVAAWQPKLTVDWKVQYEGKGVINFLKYFLFKSILLCIRVGPMAHTMLSTWETIYVSICRKEGRGCSA